MEKISNKDKKQLFLKLIEECDKGNTQRFNKDGNVFHDAGYYDYGDGWKIKNNGILGLWYAGLDEEGKHKVQLIVGGSLEERDSAILDKDEKNEFVKSFTEDELNEFLDKFFNMNNMEALNEFSGIGYFKENENYQTPYPVITQNSLEYLNIIDYINELSEGIDLQSGDVTEFKMGDGFLSDYIKVAKDYDGFYIDGSTTENGTAYITFKQNEENLQYELVEQEGEIRETESILAIVKKAMRDVPEIYQNLRAGTYKKEQFVPKKDDLQKQTTLQEREEELSTLEAEEKTISEAEALIDQQKEGQDVGEE